MVAYGPSENVPTALAEAFAKLKAEGDLKGLEGERFAGRLAFYYSELDAIHAFREGNSRTLRAFTADLAQAAGFSAGMAAGGNGGGRSAAALPRAGPGGNARRHFRTGSDCGGLPFDRMKMNSFE